MLRAVLRFLAALRRMHERLVPHLEVPRDRLPAWLFGVVLLAIVVVGAILRSRLLLVGLRPEDTWLGQPLLTSADGYYFAAGVGNVVSDEWGLAKGVARADVHALVAIGAMLVEVFGLAREAVFTWMPVVVGPLVALPLAFIGRAYGRSLLGLVAALVVVVSPSYLARTSVAYFDTDMFAVTMPLVAALFLVRLLRSEPDIPPDKARATARKDGLLAALTLSAYVWFYDQGLPLTQVLSLLAALCLLTVALLARARPAAPASLAAPEAARHALLIALATAPVYWAIRSVVAAIAHVVLGRMAIRPKTLAIIAVVATIAAFATSPAMRHLVNKLATYGSSVRPVEGIAGDDTTVPRDPGAAAVDTTWKQHDTTGIVAEARVLPFARMTAKVAGSAPLAIAGVLGCLALLLWRPSLVVVVPIAAIGAFAFFGGHRFLIYLAPIYALGIGYLAVRLTRALPRRISVATSAALGLAAIVPSVDEVGPLDVQVSINHDDVEALTAIDAVAEPTDTTISWWDYGYSIKYFAKTRIITDGSRRGDDSSLAAEILLTKSPARAAHLARLAADANAQDPIAGAAQVLFNQAKAKNLGPVPFLEAVEAGTWPAMRKEGEVYLFLTKRLLPILPVLEAFRPTPGGSDRDAAYLHSYEGVSSKGSILYLEGGIEVDADKVVMRRPNRQRGGFDEKRLREVHVLGGTGKTMHKAYRRGDPSALTAGVLLRDQHLFIEMDARMLQSQWAQLYLFENADPRYYEPIHITSTTKVYRFK